MNRSTICLLLAVMQIFAYVRAEGKYTVIAPGTIHPNDKYTAAVAVHHVDKPCQIKVGITGPSFNETKIVDVKDSEIKNVEFSVPALEKGDYNLTAEGVNCLGDFKNTTKLNYEKFDTLVRIQTDKGLYKPGDDINYRVIFLDKDLKPATVDKNSTIWFEDGKRNRIKEIHDFEVIKGVHTGKFKISEFPVMGYWRIGVSSGARYERAAHIEVQKYVLPKYVASAEATESVSVRDGDMQVVVRANYTYGKPLNGKATVILTLGSRYYYDSDSTSDSAEEKKQPPTIIKTADMVQGKAKIDLNVKELAPHIPSKEYSTYASIVATVEEEFTGVKINASTSTQIYPYRYSMHCVHYDQCNSFEADKEKEVLIQLNYVDGTHLKDTKTPVELTYTEILRKNSWYSPEPRKGEEVTTTVSPPIAENRTFTFTGFMNETGFATFKVALPDLKEYEGYSHYYNIEAHYRDEKRDVNNAYQYREPKKVDHPAEEGPKEWFKLEDKYYQNRPKLFKEDQFTINSSKPLSYIDYNIIGRGNILKSGHVDLPDNTKVYNLSLTPDIAYAPRFALYVYYVDEEGEYHYAEDSYYLDYELQNKINITAADQVKPGQEVALKIKTAPNSFVGLLAVDQSVLLLRSNNDFRDSEFGWAVGSYSTYTPPQGGYSHYPGSSVGCVTLTNADYFYNWTRPEYMSTGFSAVLDRGFVANDEMPIQVSAGTRGGHPAMAAHGQSAGGGGGGGIGGGAPIQVRKDFAETWLFDDIVNTDKEEFTWSKKIPDTITSWMVTGFAMNSEKGLAVTADKTKITTFQPFFISVRLPYSVKRGEVINVPALVFNYLDKTLDVEVTLDNMDDEFEFTEVNNEVIGDQKRSKMVRVPPNGAGGVAFMIRPKVLGNVMLKYTAVSPVAGDAVHKSMKVVPEGITQYGNRAYFVNLNKETEQKSSFELELPKDIVPDSQHVEVGVVGDILGPVVNNLDNLVRLPTGCGEQTMSSLLPNYLVMKYLQSTNRLTPNMETKLRYNMETGYQHMLNYRHTDGSFSSFGPSNDKEKPRNGSTWLTAYVTRSMQQLGDYIKVDPKIIEEGLAYLAQQQATNGSITEKGDYFYASQANLVSLTSTALLAFLENKNLATKYSKEIENGLSYISKNEDTFKSLHSQAIATYTLNKAKHAAAPEKLTKINSLAKTDGDRKWWSATERPSFRRWWLHVYSSDVEISSYVLLTLLNQPQPNIDDVFPIIRWLVAQRNSYGGFSSTQDTVVGLQALIEFAKLAEYKPAKMVVDIASKGGDKEKKETINLTEDNGILYQNVEMPDKTKSIDFAAKGTGTAMVQIAYQYNIVEKEDKPSFTITTSKMDRALKSLLSMLVCVEYKGDGEASNMAVLEINAPSGYVVEEETLAGIKEVKRVSNTELKNSDSLLVVYFDHLYKDQETCILYEATKVHAVAMQKPASIVLYDYYDSSKKATDFYEVDSKLCDICEGEEECSKCKDTPIPPTQGD